MSLGRLASQVQNGIALLDSERGPEWVWSVDPDMLHMASYKRCVLGQLYGEYMVGSADLALSDSALICHGFEIRGIFRDYAALDRLWAYAIRRLREQRTPPRVSAVAS